MRNYHYGQNNYRNNNKNKNNNSNKVLLEENRRLKAEFNRKNQELNDYQKKIKMLQDELHRLQTKSMNNNQNNASRRGKSNNNIIMHNEDNIFSDFFGNNIFDAFEINRNNIQRINPNFNPGDYEEYNNRVNNLLYGGVNDSIDQELIDQVCPNPDNMTYEQLLELEENVGKVSKGLTKNQIKKIPQNRYNKNLYKNCDDKCVICQYDFKDGDIVTKLSCGHLFHSECVDTWLSKNKVCPMCQKEIRI